MLPRLGILPGDGRRSGDERVTNKSLWSRIINRKPKVVTKLPTTDEHTKQLVLDITRFMPRGALLDSIDDDLFAKLLVENMRTRREMRLCIDPDIEAIAEATYLE